MTATTPAYHAPTLEAEVRRRWNERQVYLTHEQALRPDGTPKPKFYACSMLPYPSGKLHMGHVRNYTLNDVMARQRRMQGYNVLMPMGWDAFGLPAENAALKNRVPPAQWTRDNIAAMRRQMLAMGLAVDWSRELATCDADYYRWNQWLFLRMLEKGIAYRQHGTVNWDPVDKTVLANEQVIDGRGWRSGALVEKREIPMYYLRITQYADELLQCVRDELPGWPERVRLMQQHWIGRSEGLRIFFPHDHPLPLAANDTVPGHLAVFTTRADTLMGVSFVAIAAEHPLAAYAASQRPTLKEFIAECQQGSVMEADLAQQEKRGVDTGLTVRHPLTGAPVPVWIANYVLMRYGEGAVMGVPAHDARDFEFAHRYDLPIKQVLCRRTAGTADGAYDATAWQDWYASTDDAQMQLCNSGEFDGLSSQAAKAAIGASLTVSNLGASQTTYRLRDWGISRQRYWGTPIPIIHCEACGAVPVPDADLPVRLPEDLVPDGSGNPLLQCEAFLHVPCPRCNAAARRETDTFDTFVDSAWYFLRYCTPGAPTMVDERVEHWMPMDQYIGGIEHAVLHLLYARFWVKVMRDLGLVNFDEPFRNLLCQGMVLNHIYSRKSAQGGIDYFAPEAVDNVFGEDGRITHALLREDGSRVEYGGVGTMSKSKSNGVDPQAIIDQYGADTARLFMMFASPPEQTLEWSSAGVEGAHRYLKRVWQFTQSQLPLTQPAVSLDASQLSKFAELSEARRQIHGLLKQADFDYQRLQYNTVVSAAMKLLNTLESIPEPKPADDDAARHCRAAVVYEGLSILLRLLYPIAPHLCDALWRAAGFEQTMGDLLDAPWPVADPAALESAQLRLAVQVNGKLRGDMLVDRDSDAATIEAQALALDAVQRQMVGMTLRRVVLVPGKLVNIVATAN